MYVCVRMFPQVTDYLELVQLWDYNQNVKERWGRVIYTDKMP